MTIFNSHTIIYPRRVCLGGRERENLINVLQNARAFIFIIVGVYLHSRLLLLPPRWPRGLHDGSGGGGQQHPITRPRGSVLCTTHTHTHARVHVQKKRRVFFFFFFFQKVTDEVEPDSSSWLNWSRVHLRLFDYYYHYIPRVHYSPAQLLISIRVCVYVCTRIHTYTRAH